jgi:HEAT repeat protein
LRACRSLSDLRIDEPEFEIAAQALLHSATDNPALSDAAGEVLGIIGRRRADEANRVLIDKLVRALPQGAAEDPVRLFQLYRDESSGWEQRRAACRLLGELGPPGAQAALLEAFFADDADLAFEAANALFTMSAGAGGFLTDALQPLTAALRSANDPELKEATIYALGRVCGPGAMDPLIQVLEDPNATTNLRRAALHSLAFVGPSERARQRTTEALADSDPAIRIAAIGLVLPSWPGVSEALRKMAGDQAEVPGFGTVAENAAKKLDGELGEPSARSDV